MLSIGLLCLLATSVAAWISTTSVPSSSTDFISADANNKSISIVQYVDSNACSCNRLGNVCDYLCCCDSSCSSDLIAQWRKAGQCKSEFVEAMRSFFCDETILAFTPKLREMNTCKQI